MEPQIVKAMLIYANASAMQYRIKCIINGKLDFKWPNRGVDKCRKTTSSFLRQFARYVTHVRSLICVLKSTDDFICLKDN
jgi:hypothetical protein